MALWSLDSRDSLGATPAESKKIFAQAIKESKSVVSLQHSPVEQNVNTTLPALLSALKKSKKYKMVHLSQCIGYKPYRIETKKLGHRDASWKC